MLYSVRSGSWLAWAIGIAARYAAIDCPRWRTSGHAVQHDRHTTATISSTRPSSCSPEAVYSLTDPRMDGTLSWRWYTTVTGWIWTHDLAIASPAPYHSATAWRIPWHLLTIWRMFQTVTTCTSGKGCRPTTLEYVDYRGCVPDLNFQRETVRGNCQRPGCLGPTNKRIAYTYGIVNVSAYHHHHHHRNF